MFRSCKNKQSIPNTIECVLFILFKPNSELKKQLTETEGYVNGNRKIEWSERPKYCPINSLGQGSSAAGVLVCLATQKQGPTEG